MSFLELRGISKTFEVRDRSSLLRKARIETKLALESFDLDLERGEVVSVMGPSGCGKTTLLRLIAGLERADSGSIRLDGKDLDEVPVEQRSVGMVFQNLSLFPHYDVARNIGYGLRGEQTGRVGEMLELVGLEDYADRRIQTLSGGEQQRVALARALAPAPDVLLLDEPLSSLDRLLREDLADEVGRLLRRSGVTAIHVTHDQEEAFAIGDRVLLLMEGQKVQEGPAAEVYHQPLTPAAARFLGHQNLFELDGVFPLLDDFVGPGTLLIPDSAIEIGHGPFEATVRSASFRGAHQLYHLDVSGIELTFRGRTRGLVSGDRVAIELIPDACHYWSE